MNTVLELYMREIEDIKPMKKAEEKVYFIQWKENGSEAARQRLYTANLKFVVSVAGNYKRQHPIMELIGVGNIALDQALNEFDYTRGLKFISFAVWRIRQAILNEIGEQSRFIKINGVEGTRKKNLEDARNRLAQKLNRMPTIEELQKETGFEMTGLKHMEVMLEPMPNLDKKIAGQNSTTLGDLIEDNNITLPGADELKNKIIAFLDQSKLTDKDIFVIKSRFGIDTTPQTLEEIGDNLGVSRERARQIEDAALKALRQFDKTMARKNKSLQEFLRN